MFELVWLIEPTDDDDVKSSRKVGRAAVVCAAGDENSPTHEVQAEHRLRLSFLHVTPEIIADWFLSMIENAI